MKFEMEMTMDESAEAIFEKERWLQKIEAEALELKAGERQLKTGEASYFIGFYDALLILSHKEPSKFFNYYKVKEAFSNLTKVKKILDPWKKIKTLETENLKLRKRLKRFERIFGDSE